MRHSRPTAGRLLLIALGLIISIILVEGVLRVYVFAFPHVAPTVPDAQLGRRPNPAYAGHDSRGWRNASALAQAEVVVFGDSQTYGFNAALHEAWPQRLAVHLRRSVYQFASGGYGPAHYLLLLDEALRLRPKIILAAYYFGNDNYDAYWLVYRLGGQKRSSPAPVLDALATTDPVMHAAIATAERTIPSDYLYPDYLDCRGPRLPGVDSGRLRREFLRLAASPPGLHGVVARLTRHSLVFRAIWPRLQSSLTSVLGDYGPPLCVHHRDGALRTVFSPAYRFIVLNDADPRVVEGERISLLVFKHLAERSRGAGVQFFAVLLPTKETAFRAQAEGSARHEPLMMDFWQAEERARRRAMAFFRRERIGTIDTLHALETMIASGRNPYPENADSHPAATGYDAVARAVAARLQ